MQNNNNADMHHLFRRLMPYINSSQSDENEKIVQIMEVTLTWAMNWEDLDNKKTIHAIYIFSYYGNKVVCQGQLMFQIIEDNW